MLRGPLIRLLPVVFFVLLLFIHPVFAVTSRDSTALVLSPEEISFLENHPVLRVSNALDFPPFDFAVFGRSRGYSVDLLNLLAERIGLKLSYVNDYSGERRLEQFRQGQLDLIHTIDRTSDRESYGRFSIPYFQYKNYFIANSDTRAITDISQLYGKTLAVTKGGDLEKYVSLQHSEVNLLPVEDYSQLLEAVSNGQAEAMVGKAPAVSYMMQRSRVTDLFFSGWFKKFDHGESRKLHFMAQPNAPELISMLNKAYSSLDLRQLNALEDKWLSAPPVVQTQVVLTPEEQQFIKDHHEIVLASGDSFEPFTILNADGSISGFDVDIMSLVSERTGLKVRFSLGNWDKMQQQARKRQLDGLSSAVITELRKSYLNFSVGYIKYYAMVIVKEGNPKKIRTLADLNGKRVALQTGNQGFEQLALDTGQKLDFVYYDTLHDLIRAVVAEEVDFTILDEASKYMAQKLGLKNSIEEAFIVGNEPVEMFLGLRNDYPQLLSIVNKGLASITSKEAHEIRKRWFGSTSQPKELAVKMVSLTVAEKNYLKQKSVLNVCANPAGMPLEQIDKNNQHDGMAKDLLVALSGSLGISTQLVVAQTWAESLAAIESRKCDLMTLAQETPRRRHYLDFTTPLLTVPYVIVTSNDKEYIVNVGDHQDKTFAVVKDISIVEHLLQRYPSIKLLEVATPAEGLAAVEDKRVYGFIGIGFVARALIQKNLLSNLRFSGHVTLDSNLSVATRSDEPLLHSILQKAVNLLSEKETQRIYDRWVAVKYETLVNYLLLIKIGAGILVFVAAILFWTYTLRSERNRTRTALIAVGKEKQRTEQALHAEREAIQQNLNFVDMISHEYRTPLSVLSSSIDLLERKVSLDDSLNQGKQLAMMRKSTDRLRNIFDVSLNEKRINDAIITLDKDIIDLDALVAVLNTAVDYVGNLHPEHCIQFNNQILHPHMLRLTADIELLNIALSNLLDNACKYSSSGTLISLGLKLIGESAELIIEDQGAGIPDEDINHIFEKYYRSNIVGEKNGAGVGLFLVKKIIDLHQGGILVESTLGSGTKVTIELKLIGLDNDRNTP